MPNRILRDWTDSDRMEKLSAESERLFVRLLMKADDYGRFHAEPRRIKAALFPLEDTLRPNDIVRWLDELSTRQLILRYEVGDRALLSIPRFGQRMKQSRAKFPPPEGSSDDWLPDSSDFREVPGSSGKPPEVPARDGDGDGDGDGDESKRTHARKPRKTTIPADFGVSDRVKDWAAEKGHTRLAEHLEAFRAKCRANGYAYADWDSAFMEAIRGDWAKLGRAGNDDSRSPASQRRLA